MRHELRRLEDFEARILEVHTDARSHVISVGSEIVRAPFLRVHELKRYARLALAIYLGNYIAKDCANMRILRCGMTRMEGHENGVQPCHEILVARIGRIGLRVGINHRCQCLSKVLATVRELHGPQFGHGICTDCFDSRNDC